MASKAIQFKAFKMDGYDDEAGTVEGYASTYGGNPDKAGDVVEPGAFKTALLNGPERVRFLWEHDRKSVIGVIKEMRDDERGLYVKAQFANTQKAQETRDLMKMGAVDSFSIGYRVIKEKQDRSVLGKSINRLQEIQLFEISCVAWPCNVEARMTAIKSEVEERFDNLNLEQQALVEKFINFLETEQKSDEAHNHTAVLVEQVVAEEEPVEETKEAPETVEDHDSELEALATKLALLTLAQNLR